MIVKHTILFHLRRSLCLFDAAYTPTYLEKIGGIENDLKDEEKKYYEKIGVDSNPESFVFYRMR